MLLIFFSIYRLSLQDKKSLKFNRFYLLITLVLGLLLPLFNFSFLVEPNPVIETKEVVFQKIKGFSDFDYFPLSQKESLLSNLEILFSGISFLLVIRFVFRVYLIIRLKKSGQQIKNDFGILILHSKVKSPFSFLKSIYLNLGSWSSGLIEKEILIHEKGHVVEKHSYDILFVELLKIGYWFQPMLYFYKKAIQENHEFLADAYCLNQIENINAYQNIILNYYSKQNKQLELCSSFNYKNLKKRFIMMKNTNKGNVTKVLFYSLAFVLTYFGLVGIETKANTIKKFETEVSDKVLFFTDNKFFDEIKKDVKSFEFVDKIENSKANPKVEFSIFLNEIQDKIEKYYLNEDLQNTVHVLLNIDENGKIVNVSVFNTDDEEIKNYIKKILFVSADWNPEFKNGIAVKSKVTIPLRIKDSSSIFIRDEFIKASPKEGMQKFYSSFMKQVSAPDVNENLEIKVIVKIIIDDEGNLTNFEIVNKSIANEPFEIEFLRVLKTMPQWNPATKNGQPIASDFYFPITMKVAGNSKSESSNTENK